MKEKTMHSIKFLGLTLGIALSIFAISLAVYAWTAPTVAPPDGNVPAPINIGTTTQTKAGALGVVGVFQANNAVHLAVGGGNVGIGTTAPGQRLDVSGNIRASGEIIGTLGSGFGQFRAIAGNFGAIIRNDGNDTYLPLLTASLDQSGSWNALRPLRVNNVSGDVFLANNQVSFLHSTGNVGIGTAAPTARLDIEGQIRIRGGNPAAGSVLTSNAAGLATWTVPAGGLPTGTSGQTLRHDGTNWSANSVIFNNGTNIGIATTTPGARLHVEGNIIAAVPTAANHVATMGWVQANTGRVPSMYLTANTRMGNHNCDDNPLACCSPNYHLCYQIEMIGRNIERTGTNRHANPGILWGDVRTDVNAQTDCRGWTTIHEVLLTNHRTSARLSSASDTGVTSTFTGHMCDTWIHAWCCSN